MCSEVCDDHQFFSECAAFQLMLMDQKDHLIHCIKPGQVADSAAPTIAAEPAHLVSSQDIDSAAPSIAAEPAHLVSSQDIDSAAPTIAAEPAHLVSSQDIGEDPSLDCDDLEEDETVIDEDRERSLKRMRTDGNHLNLSLSQ